MSLTSRVILSFDSEKSGCFIKIAKQNLVVKGFMLMFARESLWDSLVAADRFFLPRFLCEISNTWRANLENGNFKHHPSTQRDISQEVLLLKSLSNFPNLSNNRASLAFFGVHHWIWLPGRNNRKIFPPHFQGAFSLPWSNARIGWHECSTPVLCLEGPPLPPLQRGLFWHTRFGGGEEVVLI